MPGARPASRCGAVAAIGAGEAGHDQGIARFEDENDVNALEKRFPDKAAHDEAAV
jgi:hypothetical protein